MKLPLVNPYSHQKTSKKELKNQIFKRVKKTIKSEFENDGEIYYVNSNTQIDKFSIDLINSIIKNDKKKHLKIIEKIDLINIKDKKIVFPFTAQYKDIILLAYFALNKNIDNGNIIFLYENISNRELDLLEIKLKHLDELFLNTFHVNSEEFVSLKRFITEIETKQPGTELACHKSYEELKQFFNQINT